MIKNKKISFDVVPVFDQVADSNLWFNFAKIETKCNTEKYNYHFDRYVKSRIRKEHEYSWEHFKNNIAFVAYHSNKMLGFATAYKIGDKKMYLRDLYVDPKYNGMGIGKSLLDKTERAASLVADSMEIVSLEGAISFYKEQGYSHPEDCEDKESRGLVKTLSKPVVGAVPVFKWQRKFLAKMNINVDNALLVGCKHLPIFAYLSINREIDGVAVRLPDGEKLVWVNEKNGAPMIPFYKNELLRAISRVRG